MSVVDLKRFIIMKSQYNLIFYMYYLMQLLPALALPAMELGLNGNQTDPESTLRILSVKLNDTPLANITDALTSSTTHKLQSLKLHTTLKPHDIPVTAEDASSPQEPLTPAAQNYFSTYYQPHIPPLGHSRPYYQPTEEPFITKFLTQPQHKQFLQQPRQQTYNNYDPTLMGSGDFGILRGGTFYSNEELSYHQEDNTDFYYSEASNTHGDPVTERFIQKYTYPEEQFAQFRDFADLNTPADTAFSQYVVVYAAKNSTSTPDRKLPNNIFDQLQQIDIEKAEEEKKRRKNTKGLSSTKRKLIKTKIIKKKLPNKSSKPVDDDPLLAVS